MFRSIKAAEKAAYDGDALDEPDTQFCIELQNELLSSSPQRPATPVAPRTPFPPMSRSNMASTSRTSISNASISDLASAAQVPISRIAEALQVRHGHPDLPRTNHDLDSKQTIVADDGQPPRNAETLSDPPGRLEFRRDSTGRLRAFTGDGHEYRPPWFKELHQKAMEDLTQKSSMSLTQPNSEAAYERFEIPAGPTPDDPDADVDDALELPKADATKQRTNSTAHTYQEDDTGHITLDFQPEQDEDEELEAEPASEDGSFAMPPVNVYPPSQGQYEPQTPAPPLNPFRQRGSVMKASDLFGATQPSSVGRHLTTPSSARPSPDVYNDFSSPPKRQRIGSSPLLLRNENDDDQTTSPLMSSVRKQLLAPSTESPLPQIARRANSFDLRRKLSHEPRPYVSMSQERRSRAQDPDTDSGSDSDIEVKPRFRNRRDIEKQIQRELSTVELRKRMPPSSSRPSSRLSSSAPQVEVQDQVEVPSTGRRRRSRSRSQRDDYVAQCEGHDARDTPQDDFIADSQALPTRASSAPDTTAPDTTAPDTTAPEPTWSTAPENTVPRPEPVGEMENALPDRPPEIHHPEDDDLAEPPQNDDPETVPETSPAVEELLPRPMRDIATVSSFRDAEEDMTSLPGFTQDVEFEAALKIASSPEPSARSFRKERSKLRTLSLTPKEQNTPPLTHESIDAIDTIHAPAEPVSNALPDTSEQAPLSTDSTLSDVPSPTPDIAAPKSVAESEEASIQVVQSENQEIQAEKQTVDQTVEQTEKTVAKQAEMEAEEGGAREEKEATPSEDDLNMADVSIDNDDLADAPIPVHSPQPPPKSKSKSKPKATVKSKAKAKSNPKPKAKLKPKAAPKPKGPAKIPKVSTPHSTPGSTPVPTRSSQKLSKAEPKTKMDSTPVPTSTSSKRANRKSGASAAREPAGPKRSSKRQSTASREDSEDPLAVSHVSLFNKMTFAVSYVHPEENQKDHVIRLITDHGGRLLEDGFDSLFIPNKPTLAPTSMAIGFTALIADEHSRRAKYVQALALGLPCISGHWILACVTKRAVVDWAPYLLCAGQSVVLGNVYKSRTLRPYDAKDAQLVDTFANRDKLLDGKNVLVVTGKGKAEEKRRAYVFLARALGPTRIDSVVDFAEARKKLVDAEQEYDLLYVDGNEEKAEAAVFGQGVVTGGSKKRKRESAAAEMGPPPKKIRVISDETMVQSLILGQLIED